MKRFYYGLEDICPECGHLMSKKPGDCPFCGRNLQDDSFSDFEMHSYDNRFTGQRLSKKLGGNGWQITTA
jgi:rRNA maturation protein Nop10